MDNLDIVQEKKDGIHIVRLDGVLDSSTCMNFGVVFNAIAEKSELLLILDLKKLKYINSVGIGTIVSNIRKIQNADGKACFYQVSDEVKHVFDLTGLSNIFFFFDDEASAVNFLSQS